jgi:chemotaxis signal transduction protein
MNLESSVETRLQAETDQKTMLEVVIVTIDAERFAFLLSDLQAVLRSKITKLPGVNPLIAGMINVQGELIGVLELGLLLGFQIIPNQEDCVLLVLTRHGKVGLHVPNLPELETIDAAVCTLMNDQTAKPEGKIMLLDLDLLLEAAPLPKNNV